MPHGPAPWLLPRRPLGSLLIHTYTHVHAHTDIAGGGGGAACGAPRRATAVAHIRAHALAPAPRGATPCGKFCRTSSIETTTRPRYGGQRPPGPRPPLLNKTVAQSRMLCRTLRLCGWPSSLLFGRPALPLALLVAVRVASGRMTNRGLPPKRRGLGHFGSCSRPLPVPQAARILQLLGACRGRGGRLRRRVLFRSPPRLRRRAGRLLRTARYQPSPLRRCGFCRGSPPRAGGASAPLRPGARCDPRAGALSARAPPPFVAPPARAPAFAASPACCYSEATNPAGKGRATAGCDRWTRSLSHPAFPPPFLLLISPAGHLPRAARSHPPPPSLLNLTPGNPHACGAAAPRRHTAQLSLAACAIGPCTPPHPQTPRGACRAVPSSARRGGACARLDRGRAPRVFCATLQNCCE